MRNENEVLLDAGRAEASPVRLNDEAIPFLVARGKPISLEKFLLSPVRPRGEIRCEDEKSFIDAVTRFRMPQSVGFWTRLPFRKTGNLRVYIDFHPKDGGGGNCDFTVSLRCTRKQALTITTKINIPVYTGKYIHL